MSKQHTWSITRVECTVNYDGNTNPVVVSAQWQLKTQNIDNFVYTSIYNGTTELNLTPTQALAISNADALTLTLSTLGAKVQAVEDENSTILDNLMIPVIPAIQLYPTISGYTGSAG
jgi:hypothetical protein